MKIRLHVLVGCRALLRPGLIDGTQVAALIGPQVRSATAFWLSPRCGRFYHDFLYDSSKDSRIKIFAQSLRDNFGVRFAPLIILPELLEESAGAPNATGDATAPGRTGLDILAEIAAWIPLDHLHLHVVALPYATGSWAREAGITASTARSRVAALVATCQAQGIQADKIEARVIPAEPGSPGFAALYRNALAPRLIARVNERLARDGFAIEPTTAITTVWNLFDTWASRGLVPTLPLDNQILDKMSDRVLAGIFAHATGPLSGS